MTRALPLLFLLGCVEPPSAPPPAPAPAPSSVPERGRLFAARLMGSPFRIRVPAHGLVPDTQAAADAAFAEVDRVERLFSEWRPDTPISAINAAAGKAPVRVDAEVLALVGHALDVARATRGAFDPTWAAFRGVWDFDADPPRLPRKSALEAARARVGWARVQVDRGGSTVFLPAPGMALGLGGIAKGYGIDRAAAVLRRHGLEHFIVNGGGDLYVAGEKAPGQPWIIGVRHPRGGAMLAELPVRDQAIVTSGDYERYFEIGGERYHHIIDLRTGMPATKSVGVTVIAAAATLADAFATGIFVLGPEGVELAEATPGLEAAVLVPGGRVFRSRGFPTQIGRWWTSAPRRANRPARTAPASTPPPPPPSPRPGDAGASPPAAPGSR